MKVFEKLVDAAGALVVATAVLYFWGFVYYAAHTEALGVPFHGIALAPQEYLTASWYAVAMLFLSSILITLVAPLAVGLLDTAADWFRKKTGQRLLTAEERGLGPATPLVILFLSACALVFGMRLMRIQGQEEAEKTLRAATAVRIWAPDGQPIAGRFVYLRNYGSTLLVREMSPDQRTVVGHRFFKDASIGGYSLDARTGP